MSVTWTADEEEVDCNRCDNMLESDEFCTECYRKGWAYYFRTVEDEE